MNPEALPLHTTRDYPGPQRIHRFVHSPPTGTHTCTHTMHIRSAHTSHCAHAYVHVQHEHTKSVHEICAHSMHTCIHKIETHAACTHSVVPHMCIQCAHAKRTHTKCTHNVHTHTHLAVACSAPACPAGAQAVSALRICPMGCFTHRCSCTRHTHG